MRLLCLLLAASSILNGIVAFPIPRIQQRSVDEAARFFHDRATIDLNLDPRSALLNSVLKRLPATTLSYAKLQPAAQLKRQTNNSGNGDSGNGNGNSGSNNGNNNNGGGGSSTTDRNIALGVGLGVGIPGAIAGMITIYKFCCRGDGDESDGEAKQKKKKEKHLRRSLPSPQDPRTQAQVPEPRGASELASQQPQRPYELATYG